MTHKDYVKIAAALADARAQFPDDAHARVGVNLAEASIADVLAADNPRFDRSRFHAAATGQPLTGRDRA